MVEAGFRGRPWPTSSLDWHESTHQAKRGRCRLCAGPTGLVDDDGQPCHKVCAEWEADELAEHRARRGVDNSHRLG